MAQLKSRRVECQDLGCSRISCWDLVDRADQLRGSYCRLHGQAAMAYLEHLEAEEDEKQKLRAFWTPQG